MANILIIDDQAWVKDLCKESLAGEGYNVLTTDDIESVMKNILSFNPHIVLLNQYLKHGFLVWDVLQDIKMQNPNLPVLIVTAHETHLFCPHLSQADEYLVKSHTAADELREKISHLFNRLSIFQKDSEFPSSIQP
jgi:DNA-binding NtrC family response regulator